MNRNSFIYVLVICFGMSCVNAALAAEIVAMPPLIVRPYQVYQAGALDQRMLNRDRQNRDEELRIKQLIEENNALTKALLARQPSALLKNINQTMLDYRDQIVSRDKARIQVNSERAPQSAYAELIALNRDVEAMKGVGQDQQEKSNLIEEKYKNLTILKDELIALNERLKKADDRLESDQQERIQGLAQKLAGADQKIAKLDEAMAQKDRQIIQLTENLARANNNLSAKNEEYNRVHDQMSRLQEQIKTMKDDFALRLADLNKSEQTINDLKGQVAQLNQQLEQQNKVAAQQDAQMTKLQADATQSAQAQALKTQGELTRMSAMLDVYQEKVKVKTSEYESKLQEILSVKRHQAQLEQQVAGLIAQLQEKDQQVVKGKEYFSELERRYSAKDRDIKARDLSLAMMQKMVDQNTAESAKQVSAQIADVERLKVELKAVQDDLAQKAVNLEYKDKEITRLKDRAKAQEASKASKSVVDDKQAAVLTGQIKRQEASLKHLKAMLDKRTKAFVDQRKAMEALRRDLKASKAQANKMRAALASHGPLKSGQGALAASSSAGLEEARLAQEHKKAALMMKEADDKVERLQTELTAANKSRQEVQAQYDVIVGEINEARAMLQSCTSQVMRQQLPLQYRPDSLELLNE